MSLDGKNRCCDGGGECAYASHCVIVTKEYSPRTPFPIEKHMGHLRGDEFKALPLAMLLTLDKVVNLWVSLLKGEVSVDRCRHVLTVTDGGKNLEDERWERFCIR